MRTTTRVRKHFSHRPLAIAAAIALLVGASLPARAQLVSSTGDVSPPFAAASSVTLTGQRVFLGFTNAGIGTSGSLSITGGGSLTAAQIVPGTGGLGIGTVTVSGAGSIINLTGGNAFNGLDIGSWGTGTVTVSNGGSIACASTLACQFNQIGNAAGSTGTLTIDGGSVSGLGQLSVGLGTLSAGFGTPGAATTATLTITNGGTLASTGGTSVAFNSGQTGLVTGNVTIDGAGSQWAITRDLVNGTTQAFLSLGQTANSVANVTISNGGNLRIIGSDPSTSNSLPGINMSGGAGGTSTMTVTSGGSIVIGGNTGVLNVGGSSTANALGATATLDITAGGTASGAGLNGLMFMSIGRNQASGTVNVSGAGSQLVLAGVGGTGTGSDGIGATLNVGRNQGFGGGTGVLNVTNGGSVLISDNGQAATNGGLGLRVGNGAGSDGTVLVSGPGSSIVVLSTGGGTSAPGVTIGDFGTGQMTISNGGNLLIDGRGTAGPNTFLNMGVNGGQGSLTVTGLGSRVELVGADPVLQVGRSGVGAQGLFSVLAGATASTLFMNVGRDGATGTMLIDGAGSQVSQAGVGATGAAGASIGRDGGNGQVTVSNGGRWLISDGGQDSRVTATNPAIQIGRGVGSTGSLVINGPGSVVEIVSTSLGLPAGTADNFNPYMSVGRDAGSSGQLTITNGGRLLIDGQAVSTVTNPRGSVLVIGGRNSTDPGGTGTALVSGTGSEIRMTGTDRYLHVGQGPQSSGTLTVNNGAAVSALVLFAGNNGGTGVINVDNATVNLSGQAGDNVAGAGIAIGRAGGTGTVNITNGSVVTISNPGSAGAGLFLGGTQLGPTGTGTLNVTDSTINVNAAAVAGPGAGQAVVRIGRDGTATATLTNSTLTVSGGVTTNDNQVLIAALPGSTGTLTLNAGSVINTGYVGVGATPTGFPPGTYTPQNAGGAGTLILNNSTINTTTFEIGALGTLGGDGGEINATGDVIVGGTIGPGESPGRIRINCNLISLAGSRLILEIERNGSGGYDIDQLIIGNDSTFDLAQFQIVFTFLGDTDPTAFAASGGFDLDNFLLAGSFDANGDSLPASSDNPLSTLFAPGDTWEDVVNVGRISAVSSVFDITSLSFDAESGSVGVIAAPVPEPSTWALMLVGLWFVASRARKLRRSPSALAPQGHVTACS